jgi:hypothetical protein
MFKFMKELFLFLRTRKKPWLWPIVILLALFAGLAIFAKGSAVAPFIYTIF